MDHNSRNESVPHNTEDKNWWLLHGVGLENRFIRICNEKLNLDALINPEKKNNPYAPDLIVNKRIADLKTQNTPFFTSTRYKIEPRFAVTFNRKDYERYKTLYPDIDIYFWVDWIQTEWRGIKVDYLGGIFTLPFKSVQEIIENENAPEHHYMHRVNDNAGNAKSSFILDIRSFHKLFATKKRIY